MASVWKISLLVASRLLPSTNNEAHPAKPSSLKVPPGNTGSVGHVSSKLTILFGVSQLKDTVWIYRGPKQVRGTL